MIVFLDISYWQSGHPPGRRDGCSGKDSPDLGFACRFPG